MSTGRVVRKFPYTIRTNRFHGKTDYVTAAIALQTTLKITISNICFLASSLICRRVSKSVSYFVYSVVDVVTTHDGCVVSKTDENPAMVVPMYGFVVSRPRPGGLYEYNYNGNYGNFSFFFLYLRPGATDCK